MGKILKATPSELETLFRFSTEIPADKVSSGRKLAGFRSAIRIALKPYNDGISTFKDVLSEDAKGFDQSKKQKEKELKDLKPEQEEEKKKLEDEIAELNKALVGVQEDFDSRFKKYQEEHKDPIEANFNEEDFNFTKELFSDCAKDIFKIKVKNAEGKDMFIYNAMLGDALFELLDKAE